MLYFIVNALSGKGKGKEVSQKIQAILENKKVAFQMLFTEAKQHAVSLAKELSKKEDCKGIIAVGGDGTFSEVLNGIDTKIPLGFVSSGSGNDFIRTFAPEKTLEEQLKPILENKTKQIDYIEVNDRRSLNVAGTGFDVDILLREEKVRKVLKGSLSYYTALIITLFTIKFRNFKITIDDKTEINEPCLIMAMANGRYFGGGMPISLDSSLDDGLIDLTVVKKVPLYSIPGLLLRFMKGTLKYSKKYVDVYRCTKIKCQVTPQVKINLDGELFDMPDFTAVLKKGELTVFG